mmetsp:Transcript_41137/g.39650  ORF Transcript_41137/g.39650 Transcript_41137/m.39650 type:complete len:300 (+) Transcript_41137:1-900(+)
MDMLTRTIIASSLLLSVLGGPEAFGDLVPYMPGMDVFSKFQMYSGYLPLAGSSLHYVFDTSQNDPVNDPFLIWFNGGPGCSSLGGWGTEHGPYVIDETYTTFHYNPYSWNTFANVLYIESPGGVGYSTCDSVTDCTFDDDSTAADNLRAVIYFFETLFPEYLPNELYLTGESYAGIYVPYLLDLMHKHNQDESRTITFNLKGMMVGNGDTNMHYDALQAGMQMTYWHGFYSDTIHDIFEENDCYSQFSILSTSVTAICLEAFIEYENQMTYTNPYNIYGPCAGAEPATMEGPETLEESD